MRAPVFAGIEAGVGTSTLAAALHGVDGGPVAGHGRVDVLVCRLDSLDRASAVGAPVLAVITDEPIPLARFGTVVTVPDVAAWHGLDAPEVAGLLALAPVHRPARLKPYIDALLDIAAALVASGVLGGPIVVAGVRRPVPIAVASPVAAGPVAAGPVAAGPTYAATALVAPAGRTRPSVWIRSVEEPAAQAPPDVSVPAVPRGPGERVGAARDAAAGDRPLWRGLQAVERGPVLLRAAAPAPVPLRRSVGTVPVPVAGRPLRLQPEERAHDLDDDALESMRAG